MNITQHPYTGTADQQRMAALTHVTAADNLHVVDLLYRLSSWAFDYPENISLWSDEQGQLVAWAVLQTPFWAIDYAYDPAVSANMHQRILSWADQTAQKLLDTASGRPIWFINVFADQHDRIRDLEQAGFASQANVGEDSWSKVLMLRPAQMRIEHPQLPAGFTLRPLAGAHEAAAYVELHRAVFASTSMTDEWRRRTVQRPEYIPELDLVIEAPDGRLAAFCVCWYDEAGPAGCSSGQIEPLGVREEYRHLGLARAILAEGIERLQQRGAEQIFVETDDYRDAAFQLYQSVGFCVSQNVLVYRKDYGA